MQRSHHARRLAAALLVLAGAACGDNAGSSDDATEPSGTPMTASPSDPTTTTSLPERTLVFDSVQEPPVIGERVCAAEGVCVGPFSILGSATGDLGGTSAQAGAAVLLQDGAIFATSALVFTGSIGGCSGSVAMTSTGFNRAGETSGNVDIIPDTGTDELIGITGLGTVVTGAADPAGGDQATSRIELRVGSSCSGDATEPGSRTAAEPPDAAPVTFEVALPAATVLPQVCNGPACVSPVTRTGSTITGALAGVTASAGSSAPRPAGGYVGVGLHRFSGSVQGCGDGTMAWSEEILSVDGTAVTGTWRVVDGSGTGDLVGVAGGGTFEGNVAADGSGTGTAVGSLSCDT